MPHLVLRSRTDSDDPRDFVATLRHGVRGRTCWRTKASIPSAARPSGDGGRAALDPAAARRRGPAREDELRETCPALVSAVRIVDAGEPGSEPGTGHGAAVGGRARARRLRRLAGTGRRRLCSGGATRSTRLPALEELGWSIETEPPFGLELERLDELDADVSDEGGGWFELALAMTHGGERFALLLPLVVEWLRAGGARAPARRPGGERRLARDPARGVHDRSPTRCSSSSTPCPRARRSVCPRATRCCSTSSSGAGARAGGGATWRGGEALFALAAKLRRFDGVRPATLPDTVNATLRPYQLEGVAWLGFLAEVRLRTASSPTTWGSARRCRRSPTSPASTPRDASTGRRWWSRRRACSGTGRERPRVSCRTFAPSSGTARGAPRRRSRRPRLRSGRHQLCARASRPRAPRRANRSPASCSTRRRRSRTRTRRPRALSRRCRSSGGSA